MIIGVPKEIKVSEGRVGLTESGIKQLILEGHQVYVEESAGLACHITNEAYEAAGAHILPSAVEVYDRAEMIVKVKEPLPDEFDLMKEGQILYTYLHLAAEPELTKVLCERKMKAVAYETIQNSDGSLPLLKPMSEVAGRMATQVGAFYLQNNNGGPGILLGGATGVHKAHVTIIGGGVAGTNAAKMAVGLGAKVVILENNLERMEFLDNLFQGKVHILFSNSQNISEQVAQSDLLVGAVLLAGKRAPQLITKAMVKSMSKGSVVVDVAVDQGGCIETCRPTNHKAPTYEVDGVIHYCVPNMPAVVARTSTYALTNATFCYCSMLASMGVERAIEKDLALSRGLNCYDGYVTYEAVAKDLNMEYRNYKELI